MHHVSVTRTNILPGIATNPMTFIELICGFNAAASTDLKEGLVALHGSAPKQIISSIVSRCFDWSSVNNISRAREIAERALLNSIPQSGIT